MRLSIVIPCFNEVSTIEDIIDAVIASPYPDKEIIVVDDCSTDGTVQKLKTVLEPSGKVHQIIFHEVNQH
jgi:glycosyltransferase involved in cell wall biosynthesis